MTSSRQAQEPTDTGEFSIKDCALVAIATGRKAVLLQELRDGLQVVEAGSIYHHFWGGLLQPRFEEREYNNDFAAWARHGLHDAILAERLAVVDPRAHGDLENLRQALLEIIETRLDEAEYLNWARAHTQFEFTRSQIVVFDTDKRLRRPAELAASLPHLSTSSIFYHFIDARRRTPQGTDDLSLWLASFDDQYHDLNARLAIIDPYFGSLSELRDELTRAFKNHFPDRPQ